MLSVWLGRLDIDPTCWKPEDVARLSPLEYQHINFLGRYSFALTESIARGELRSLRASDEELPP